MTYPNQNRHHHLQPQQDNLLMMAVEQLLRPQGFA
jgi:hypothetical protein